MSMIPRVSKRQSSRREVTREADREIAELFEYPDPKGEVSTVTATLPSAENTFLHLRVHRGRRYMLIIVPGSETAHIRHPNWMQ